LYTVQFVYKYKLRYILIIVIQIEREKADLSVQLISFSERLEEAEGGAESQVIYQTR